MNERNPTRKGRRSVELQQTTRRFGPTALENFSTRANMLSTAFRLQAAMKDWLSQAWGPLNLGFGWLYSSRSCQQPFSWNAYLRAREVLIGVTLLSLRLWVEVSQVPGSEVFVSELRSLVPS